MSTALELLLMQLDATSSQSPTTCFGLWLVSHSIYWIQTGELWKQHIRITNWNSICMWHFNTPGEMDVFCIAKSWHWSHYGDFRGKKRSFVSLTWSEITNVIFLQTLWYFLQAVKEMSYIYLYTFMHLLLSSMW